MRALADIIFISAAFLNKTFIQTGCINYVAEKRGTFRTVVRNKDNIEATEIDLDKPNDDIK